MARILFLLVTGPENPTRAALGLLVARTARSEGHEVQVFLAGDAVDFARAETAAAASGVGTGSISEHLDALAEAGAPLFLSGMSSKARGIDASVREGIELVQPQKLVELIAAAEKTVTF